MKDQEAAGEASDLPSSSAGLPENEAEKQRTLTPTEFLCSSLYNERNPFFSASKTEEDEGDLKYDAHHVITVILPVSFCMITVILTMNTIGYYSHTLVYLPYTPFVAKTDNVGELLWKSVLNGLIFIFIVATMTFGMILLYKYRCYTVRELADFEHIGAVARILWYLPSGTFFFGKIDVYLEKNAKRLIIVVGNSKNYFNLIVSLWTLFLWPKNKVLKLLPFYREVFITSNIAVDYLTTAFIIWNFSVMGLMCIHWIGPLRAQQVYLVIISALMALTFIKFLPDWTVWAVLFLVALWDLFAVLSPRGPLRILIEIAQNRGESLFPSLIYSSAMVYPYSIIGTALTTYETLAPDEGSSDEQQTSSSETGELFLPAESDSQRNSNATDGTNLLFHENPKSQPVHRYAPHRHVKVTIKDGGEVNSAIVQDEPSTSGLHANESLGSVSKRTTRSKLKTKGPKESAQGNKGSENKPENEDEERGVKLGLGDFIFYSVLVGKASSYGDWNTTAACYAGILIVSEGLCFTLILLAIFRKALPALPISIAFGLVFYISTRTVISPFCDQVSARQINF
ncbi:unnamed protein product [Enterobius vermicularis]|uniref:Presenilin n=1 Tax=Enterobius vermicularis TaxID=51028 RepID=A0A0N4V7K4_ENTVE|nr:unnamed protein product [Enterobius vermicularis]